MNYDKGFISLHRQFRNWRYYKNNNAKAVFIHCLLSASWKDEVITNYQGKTINPPIVIPQGSFITSYRKLSEELGMTIGEIREAFRKLTTPMLQHTVTTHSTTHSTTQEITLTTTQSYTIVNVVKYKDFQEVLQQLQHSDFGNSNTHNNTEDNTQLQQHINNNTDKKIKRYKDKSTDVHFINHNSLTLKLLKNGYIADEDVPEMYDELFNELEQDYPISHINVVLDYILQKTAGKEINNKYSYLKKALDTNAEIMSEKMSSLFADHEDEVSEETQQPIVQEEEKSEELTELLDELHRGVL